MKTALPGSSIPMYTEVVFSLDRLVELAPKHPEWKDKQPFKAVIEGDRAAMAKFSEERLDRDRRCDAHRGNGGGVRQSREGLDREGQAPAVEAPLHGARLPTDARGDASTLRANGYKTYIVTGGTQPFVRAFAEKGLRYSTRTDHRHGGRNQVHSQEGGQRPRSRPEVAPEQQQRR